MKVTKKVLSVFLAVLMILSCMTAALPSLVAFASTKYPIEDVYDLVKDAVENGSGSGSWNANTYTFTGDNGLAMAAADALYDYAVSSAKGLRQNVIADNSIKTKNYGSSDNSAVRTGVTFYFGAPNSSDDLAAQTITDLKTKGDVSTEMENFVKAVLGNGGSTQVYGWNNRKTTNNVNGAKQNKSVGDDVTTSSKVNFQNASMGAVDKVIQVSTNVNSYLMRFDRDSIKSAETTVVLNTKYTFDHKVARYAEVTTQGSTGFLGINGKDWKCRTDEWHQIESVAREVGEEKDTTSVELFKTYLNAITLDMLNTSYETMLTWNLDALKAAGDKLNGYLNGNDELAGLTKEAFWANQKLINKYFPGLTGYSNNLVKAYNVLVAKNAMDILEDYMGKSYDATDEAKMGEILGKVDTALDWYNKINNTAYAEEVLATYPVYSGYANAAAFKAAVEAYRAKVYHDYSLVAIYTLKSNLEDLINTYGDKVSDPYAGEDIITTDDLVGVNSIYQGFAKSVAEYKNSAIDDIRNSYNEVFVRNGNFEATVNAFAAKLSVMVAERDAEDRANEILETITYYATSESLIKLSNAEAMARYDKVEVMNAAIAAELEQWKANLGNDQDLTNYAFRVLLENDPLYTAIVDSAVALTKANVKGRNDAQLAIIAKYNADGITDWSSAITIYNFSAVSNAVRSFDTPLYEYCLAKGWVDTLQQNTYDSFDDIAAAVADFKANDGYISTMKTKHLYDANGIFNTRYGSSHWDDNKGELGYPNDIARTEGEDFAVTKTNVDATIANLDKFVSSQDFATLIGLQDLIYEAQVKRAEANGEDPSTVVKKDYVSLSEVIEDLLNNLLYTDDMFNKIMGALYPMVVNLLVPMLKDLTGLGVDMIIAPKYENDTQAKSSGHINLEGMKAGDVTLAGGLDIYLDGQKDTDTMVQLFESLGLYIFPESLGRQIKENYPQYSAIADQLIAAKNNWAVFVGDDGDIPLTFDWNVTDADSFITVLSIILSSLGNLLDAVLFDQPVHLETSTNAVYAYGTIGVSGVHPSLNTKAGLGVTIDGLNVYENVWAKLLDSIGVHDYAVDINGNSSANTIAHALLNPILDLVDEIADAPIERVLDIVPNLLFILSMDKLTDIVDTLKLGVSIDLKINWDTIDGNDLGADIAVGAVKLAKSSIDKATTDMFKVDLDIAEMLLKDKETGEKISLSQFLSNTLGVNLDYTDINALLATVLEMLEIEGLSLPLLDIGQIISTSTYREYNNKFKKTRFTLDADRADILYYLLKWVFGAVGSEGIQDLIMGLLGDSLDEPIADFLMSTLAGIGNNADDVVAALIELFNMRTYGTMDMDWYLKDGYYTGADGNVYKLADDSAYLVDGEKVQITDFNLKSIPYLAYNNDWTRDKSVYLMENMEEIIDSILKMAGADFESVDAALSEGLSRLFTNQNLSGVMKGLTGLGYLLKNQRIYDLIASKKAEGGLDLQIWARSFGDLFPEVHEDEYPDQPDLCRYHYNNGLGYPTGTTFLDNIWADVKTTVDENGETVKNYTWHIKVDEDGEEVTYTLVDGAEDAREVFLKIFLETCHEFAPVLSMIFSGGEFKLFNDAFVIPGYANYKNSIGILFEILGFHEIAAQYPEYAGLAVLSQEDYNALDPIEAFDTIVNQLFMWLDYMTSGKDGGVLSKIVQLFPRFTYFVQSNGVSVLLHNLLMPVWVLVDIIRPILDVDINSVLSTVASDLLNSISAGIKQDPIDISINLDISSILGAISGGGIGGMLLGQKTYHLDINRITFDSLLSLIDTFVGTKFAQSNLMKLGVNLACSAPKKIEGSVLGTAYGSSMDAVDAITLLICSFLEAMEEKIYVIDDDDEYWSTNGEQIIHFAESIPLLKNMLDDIGIELMPLYKAIIELIHGMEYDHYDIDWDYMFTTSFTDTDVRVTLPTHTNVYLAYSNDWKKDNAEALNDSLDDLVAALLGEDNDLATLLNGILEDNVYTPDILNMVVELIVNAISGLDEVLRDTVDVTLDVGIKDWFAMCELLPVASFDDKGNFVGYETDDDGEIVKKYQAVEKDAVGNVIYDENRLPVAKTWGLDEEGADLRATFIAALEEVLAPANNLIAWLFLGKDIKLYTGSQKDLTTGEYIYNDLITINGSEGYDHAIVPILEALGVEGLKGASYYKDAATGKYDAAACVGDILNELLNRVDEIAGQPAHEVIALLPNIIYFINANGLSAACNNLVAPINSILATVGPALNMDPINGATNLGELLQNIGLLDFDFSDLSMQALLNILMDKTGIEISEELQAILYNFMLGELTQFVSANGEYAYRMTFTETENAADMITIILSFALDVVKQNRDFIVDLLGEDKADLVDKLLDVIKGVQVADPSDPDWFYMADPKPETAVEIEDLLNNTELSAANITYITEAYLNGNTANIWTKEKVDTIVAQLADIVDSLISEENGGTLNNFLSTKFAEANLYTEENLNKLGFMVGGLLETVDAYVGVIDGVLGTDLAYYKQFVDPADYVVDEATNKLTNEEFAEKFAEMLKPISPILDWLLFGDDVRMFVSVEKDGEEHLDGIRINGGYGYRTAVAPLLEALGIVAPAAPDGTTFEDIAADVFLAIMAKIDAICNASGDNKAIDEVLNMLPNLIYFINSNGLCTALNNLLLPVNALYSEVHLLLGDLIDTDAVDFAAAEDVQDLVNGLLNGLLADKLNAEINIDLHDVRFNVVSDVVKALTGIDIQGAIENDTYNRLEKLFVGVLESYDSATGKTGYRAVNKDDFNVTGDLITIILCAALDVVKANAEEIDDLLGEDSTLVRDIVSLIGSLEVEVGEAQIPEWFYMLDHEPTADEIAALLGDPTLSRENVKYLEAMYNSEGNLWSPEVAEMLGDKLAGIVDMVIAEATEYDSLDAMLNNLIEENAIFTEYTLASVRSLVGGLLENIDALYVELIGVVLAIDLSQFRNAPEPTEEMKGIKLTKAKFADELADMLEPISFLLDWLLFGQNIELLYDREANAAIKLVGANGYNTGLAPILEALGINVPVAEAGDTYEDIAKPLFLSVLTWVEDLCNVDDDTRAVDVVLGMLPNIIYFINANGLGTSINNLLLPVNALFDVLGPVLGMEGNVTDLINGLIAGMLGEDIQIDLNDIHFNVVSDVVKALTGIDIQGAISYQTYNQLDKLFVGILTEGTGVNAYYAANDEYAIGDLITIILCIAFDVLKDEDNAKAIDEMIGGEGSTLVQDIMKVLADLKLGEVQTPDWFYMAGMPADHVFTEEEIAALLASDTLSQYNTTYIKNLYEANGNLWTRKAVNGLVAALADVVDQVISDATDFDSLNAFLNDMFTSGKLYSEYNLNVLGSMIGGLLENVDTMYLEMIGVVLGADLSIFNNYVDPTTLDEATQEAMKNNILTNEAFAAEIAKMLGTVDFLLDWLLFGKDITLLYDKEGAGAVTLPGANGYATAVAPILEALSIKAPASPDGATFSTMAVPVFTAIMDKIDSICKIGAADETQALNVVLDMLPNLIYFVNANGLGTALNNLLLPVNALFQAAGPVVAGLLPEDLELDFSKDVQNLVNGLVAGLLPGVEIDLHDVRFNVISDVVKALTGIEIQDAITKGVYNRLDKLFVGKLAAADAGEFNAYKAVNTEDAIGDLITIILCAAIDVVKYKDEANDVNNAAAIDELLGGDSTLVQKIVGIIGGLNYGDAMDINWFYMADPKPTTDAEIAALLANSTNLSAQTVSYILKGYHNQGNLWTEASAQFLSDNLINIADIVLNEVAGKDLNTLLHDEFENGKLYSEYTISKLGYTVGNLISGLPEVYLNVAGIVLDIDLSIYTQYTEEPDVALKDVVLEKKVFAKKLADLLRPIDFVLDWLLFGKDITLLYDKEDNAAITLKGNDGYSTGLLPILEALRIKDLPAVDANSDFDNMIEPVLLAVMGKIDEVCNAGDDHKAAQVVIDLLPNIVYFLNADGATAAINNLLMPVNVLFAAVAPITGMSGTVTDLLNELLADNNITVDLTDISFKTVSDVVLGMLGIDIQRAVATDIFNKLDEIYLGKLTKFTSTNGSAAYYAANTETAQRDLLSIILCAALDVLKYPANEEAFVKLLGADIYNSIMKVLTLEPDPEGTHQNFDWLYVGENGILEQYKEEIFSPLRDFSDATINYGYDEYWTRDKAMYVAGNLNDFINGLMKLLGIRLGSGITLDSIGTLVTELVGENLYTNKNAAALAAKIAELIGKFSSFGDGLIVVAVDEFLGIDLAQYEKYADGNYDFGIETGDKEAFVNTLVDLLEPLAPILRVILTSDNLSILYDKDGNDAVTIYGGEGYKYGIIPLLEAFDRNNPEILSAESYKELTKNDDRAMIELIINPLLYVVDKVLADPLNELFALLPGLVYFIDSNGVDTVVQNLVRPVNNVLDALAPITGKADLYDIIGMDLSDIDFQWIVNLLVEKIGGAVDAELIPLAINAVVDMTMGKIVEFDSRNGDKAYTMDYVEGEINVAGLADMITVVLRYVLYWITIPENQETIRNLIRDNIDGENASYVIALYQTLVEYLEKPHGINQMLGILYYIYYGMYVTVDGVNNWHDDVNSKWAFMVKLLGSAESDYLKGFGDTLNKIFGYTQDVVDPDGIASNGAIPFFQRILNWFQKIINWFKNLFK